MKLDYNNYYSEINDKVRNTFIQKVNRNNLSGGNKPDDDLIDENENQENNESNYNHEYSEEDKQQKLSESKIEDGSLNFNRENESHHGDNDDDQIILKSSVFGDKSNHKERRYYVEDDDDQENIAHYEEEEVNDYLQQSFNKSKK